MLTIECGVVNEFEDILQYLSNMCRYGVCSYMGLRYLTFMGRNLENRKNFTLVRIMNSVGMNSKDIVNNVEVFSGSVVMNSIFNE